MPPDLSRQFAISLCLVLGACDARVVGDPADNSIAAGAAKAQANGDASIDARTAPPPPARNAAPKQDPNMPRSENERDPAPNSPGPRSPRATPTPDIQPSPHQPPAEVDPVHRDAGDEVPH